MTGMIYLTMGLDFSDKKPLHYIFFIIFDHEL